jgi:hypothetical protein
MALSSLDQDLAKRVFVVDNMEICLGPFWRSLSLAVGVYKQTMASINLLLRVLTLLPLPQHLSFRFTYTVP